MFTCIHLQVASHRFSTNKHWSLTEEKQGVTWCNWKRAVFKDANVGFEARNQGQRYAVDTNQEHSSLQQSRARGLEKCPM